MRRDNSYKGVTILLILSLVFIIFTQHVKINEFKRQYKVLEDEKNKTIQDNENLYELRNELDIKFYRIIEELKNNNIDFIRTQITSNINLQDNKLVSTYKNLEKTFELPSNDYYFRQRYYYLKDNNTKYYSGYEIHEGYGKKIEVVEVVFCLINGEWKLDWIDRDIG